jgi:hypothetical protein
MKLICVAIVITIICVKVSFGQGYKAYDIGIYSKDKKLKGAHYYYVNADTAILLPMLKDKLLLDTTLLKKKMFTLLVIYEKNKIVFKVRPDDFFYIKICIFKDGHESKYEINLGQEYVTTVTPSRRTFIFIN